LQIGYRSHFLPTGIVTADTLEAQLIAWLDEEAANPEWLDYKENSKQLSLF